jgi:hypothetical protein
MLWLSKYAWAARQLPQVATRPKTLGTPRVGVGAGLGTHAPAVQVAVASQVPQMPPQPSSPHARPWHVGVQPGGGGGGGGAASVPASAE